MKNILRGAAALMLLLPVLSSCYVHIDGERIKSAVTVGNDTPGDLVKSAREIPAPFDKISVKGAVDITFVQDPSVAVPEVVVSAPGNYHEAIVTEVYDGTLGIEDKRQGMASMGLRGDCLVEVRGADLTGVSIAGASDFVCKSLSTSSFGMSIAGSGDVSIASLSVPDGKASVSIAGSGDVVLEGVDAGILEIKVAGSGDVVATGKALHTDVQVFGSGNVDLRGIECSEINSTASGSGTVRLPKTKK